MVTDLERGGLRYCHAQSRHDSGVGACLVESGLYLSILVYLLGLVFIFSPSLAFIYLLLLFLYALAFIFSVTRSFSLPEFSFFPFWARVAVFSTLASTPSCGLAALCLLPVWSRGAVLCRLGRQGALLAL